MKGLFEKPMTMISQWVSYAFWWTIVTFLTFFIDIFLMVAPKSLVDADMIEFFEDDCNVKVTTLDDTKKQDVTLGAYDKEKYNCEILVKHPDFFKRVAQEDFLALGESFMEGWFECDRLDDLLASLANGFEHLYPIVSFIQKAKHNLTYATNNQTREKSGQVVEEHYNLGNDLYELMLDPSMNYTCAYWKEDTKTLEEAQINKMDLIARKLNLKPGMLILDIGSGFGAMAKYLAKNYDVSVVCYNISTEQVKYAKKNCEGLDVTFITEDYRNATGQYDRIYSIGFFEHVGAHNFREYFEVVHRCLKDDGLTLLHSITCNASHPGASRGPTWLTKYIFPGGETPYPSEYFTYSEDLFTVEDMQSLGKSYVKTLLAWHKNFNDNWAKHLKEKYDSQQGGKFFRMWNFYLLSCAGGFDCRAVQLHQVVYSKRGRKEEYKAVR